MAVLRTGFINAIAFAGDLLVAAQSSDAIGGREFNGQMKSRDNSFKANKGKPANNDIVRRGGL